MKLRLFGKSLQVSKVKLSQSVAPTSEPITLAEMKLFISLTKVGDDALVESYITTARQKAESIINRQLMPCTYELYFDVMPSEITLHRPPFVNLVSFQAFDGDVWNDVTDYELDDKSTPALLYAKSTPTISSNKNSVKVVYKAGYEDASKVPESIKSWIRIEVGYMYDQEAKRINVDALLNSYRVIPV